MVNKVYLKGRNNGNEAEGGNLKIYVSVDELNWNLCGTTTALSE
jgi:hypothetical protein